MKNEIYEVLRSLIYHGRGRFSEYRDEIVLQKSYDRIIEVMAQLPIYAMVNLVDGKPYPLFPATTFLSRLLSYKPEAPGNWFIVQYNKDKDGKYLTEFRDSVILHRYHARRKTWLTATR